MITARHVSFLNSVAEQFKSNGKDEQANATLAVVKQMVFMHNALVKAHKDKSHLTDVLAALRDRLDYDPTAHHLSYIESDVNGHDLFDDLLRADHAIGRPVKRRDS